MSSYLICVYLSNLWQVRLVLVFAGIALTRSVIPITLPGMNATFKETLC